MRPLSACDPQPCAHTPSDHIIMMSILCWSQLQWPRVLTLCPIGGLAQRSSFRRHPFFPNAFVICQLKWGRECHGVWDGPPHLSLIAHITLFES